jgi:nucleoside-diphosphate kinase
MTNERTLIILKPDTLRRGLEYGILDRLQRKGFVVSSMYKANPSEELLRQHYAEPIAKHGAVIGEKIIRSMQTGPIIIAIIEGNDAINEVRKFCGDKTEPAQNPAGTIRYDYSIDTKANADLHGRSIENIVHTSDSPESASREIALWFGQAATQSNDFSHLSVSKTGDTSDELNLQEIVEVLHYEPYSWLSDIVNDSNRLKVLYHGIKNPAYLSQIQIDAELRAKTPECGGCSFWSTGSALFLPIDDSPLFRYSGSYDPAALDSQNRNNFHLSIAATRYDDLKEKGIALPDYEPDGQMKIYQAIPTSLLTFVESLVSFPNTTDAHKLREYRQAAERLLLRNIDLQLTLNLPNRRLFKSITLTKDSD